MTVRPGFTLVEVMVSLLIFSLIAAAGVGLLTVSITNREVVAGATAEGASLMRAHRSLKMISVRRLIGRSEAPQATAPRSGRPAPPWR